MKKWLSILIVASLFLANNLFADTSVLIDFNKLKANGNGYDPAVSLAADDATMKDFTKHDKVNRTQHMPTLVDYSGIAGSNYTADELKRMQTSLAAYNWQIVINSSAASVENMRFSKALEWHTKWVNVIKDDSTRDVKEGGGYSIMGIRIHFPEYNFNNWALIKPPFEIPAYEDITTNAKGETLKAEEIGSPANKGNKFINGYGVIKNVGIIKSMSIKVYGCQFKNSITILLKDSLSITTEYPMGYLDYDGWKVLTWNNPNYVDDAGNRALYVVPLYPYNIPYIKLAGFRLYRQGDQYGGDFVTYIKDVSVTYDKATLDKAAPIDHELAWSILQDRTTEAKKREFSKIGQREILKYLEKMKMDKTAQ